MRLSLAFAYPAEPLAHLSPEERARVWAVVDAVSVNVLAPKAAELVADVRASRPCLPIRTHSYVGGTYGVGTGAPKAPRADLEGSSYTTPAQARDRGRRDAAQALSIGAEAHEMNGEAGMWRGKVRRRNAAGVPDAWHFRPDVAALFDAWLDGWEDEIGRQMALSHSAFVEPHLHDLSFGDPLQYYPGAPALSKRWNAATVFRCLMGYGTSDKAGEARNLAYYDRILDGLERRTEDPIHLWPGVGRVTGSGDVVGSDEALRALVLQRRPRLEEICGYVGTTAWRQLIEGNPEFAPIVDLWPALRALAGGGEA